MPESTPAASPAEPSAAGQSWVVDDTAAAPAAGQMRKTEFLNGLQEQVRAGAQESLAGTGRTTRDCPYIEFWFGFYSAQSAAYISRAVRRYAPETASATSAAEAIRMIRERVQRAVAVWAATGGVTGVPEGLPPVPGAPPPAMGRAGTAAILAKGREGGARRPDDPHAIQARLGAGRPLDASIRARMEPALGADFSAVRVHTDASAGALSSELNAHAFTVGSHVAFAAGEYRPGSPVGDALLAHELAHVVQQGGTAQAAGARDDSDNAALDRDADAAAAGALGRFWGSTRAALEDLRHDALPRLKSGLSLQRCSRDAPTAGGPRCVMPTGVQNGPGHSAINDAGSVGMSIDITVLPNNPADLAGVQDSEKVSPSVDHTGSFAGLPATVSSTSGFMAATGIPPDRHTIPKALLINRADNHGGNGSISFLQLDVFKHPGCGVTSPQVIPSSGYRIRHTLTAGPGTQIMNRTEKSAEAVTVDGFSANAGPSPTFREDNQVRP